jgi:micrococcal nuclease
MDITERFAAFCQNLLVSNAVVGNLRKSILLMILLALACAGIPSSWIGRGMEIAQADEITIKRDNGTEESFRVSNELIEKAMIMAVRFSPFVLPAWEGKVVEITRADEIKVMKNDLSVESVRLYGVDGPIEPNPFGKEAAAYTAKRVLGKMVKVQPLLLPDPWNRVIAWVWVDGESLNEELLKKGIVWWFRKYVPWEKGLAKLEAEAREARVGLWSLPPTLPPWEMQAIPAGQQASQRANKSPSQPESQPANQSASKSASPTTAGDPGPRRGSVREKLISEEGAPRKVFGDAGSVRQRLLKSQDSEEKEPAATNILNPAP